MVKENQFNADLTTSENQSGHSIYAAAGLSVHILANFHKYFCQQMLYSCVTLQYNFHSLSAIIESRGLTKRFGSFTAVSDLSFTIAPGDVYGFLGQNGAGKSTTMRMMLGLIHPDAGQVFIKGTAFTRTRRELLRYIGAIIERPDMYGA